MPSPIALGQEAGRPWDARHLAWAWDKSVPRDLASGQSTVASYLTSVNRTVSRYNVAKGSIGWLILLAAILPAFHTLKKMQSAPCRSMWNL